MQNSKNLVKFSSWSQVSNIRANSLAFTEMLKFRAVYILSEKKMKTVSDFFSVQLSMVKNFEHFQPFHLFF